MPLQNRVTPHGEIIAHPARGLFMGNRGILHDAHQRLGRARWRHKAWICCLLRFKGRQRQVMAPRRYTELFFLDEAVALAAGHRPCAECRRADYNQFRDAWTNAFGNSPKAAQMDDVLHAARTKRALVVPSRALLAPDVPLPDGTFIRWTNSAVLLWRGRAFRYAPEGYREIPLPEGPYEPLTPAPMRAALAAGYRPHIHPSASI